MPENNGPTDEQDFSGTGAGNSGPDLDLPAQMFRSGKEVKDIIVTMHRRNIGLVNDRAKYTVVADEGDELALFEGDIVLGTEQEIQQAKNAARGIGIKDEKFRWPDGIIPYVVVATLENRVEDAIAHWQQRTPFRFVKRTTEVDYISFERRNGCWSRVGRQGGVQVISLGFGCGLGPAIHEIGHALGLFHEQSRSDRDDHIKIIEENIDQEFAHNFDKHIQDGVDLGAYDYGSIMHYPPTAFSINGQPTIVTKDGQSIGQRNGLSAGDIAAMRMLYPKLNWA